MKKLIFASIALLITSHTLTYGQIVESSCEAPDSIVQDYRVDASVITLRKFYDNNSPWADSIEIPEDHIDTALNALLAIWNVDELSARDTVVDMLEIDAAINYGVNYFYIKCDTSIFWINQIIEGNAASGNDTVDNLMNLYNLSYDSHIVSGGVYFVFFSSINCYNMLQLSTLFEDISGVISVVATSGYDAHLNKNIEMSIHSDYVTLHYSYGWDDCPSGCLNWRYWDFKVYYDCSVEYIGSYGNVLEGMSVFEQNKETQIEIYPNPCHDNVNIRGLNKQDISIVYSMYKSNGIKVLTGKTTNNRIEFNGKLNNGLYILELYTDKETIRKKIQIQKH